MKYKKLYEFIYEEVMNNIEINPIWLKTLDENLIKMKGGNKK